MPILEPLRPARTVTLPPRAARHGGRTDVLVVGGGPAGTAAAYAAADAGAEVVLVERYGFLGGNATVALVMPLMSFHNEQKQAVFDESGGHGRRLLPTDHGEGEPVVAGFLWLLLDRLTARGGCIPPSPDTGYTVPFDPELYKLVLLDLLDEAGVRMLFHSFASAALPLDDGWRVVFETKSGPVVIDAGVVVDGTGDGDIAAACGAPYEIGRPEDGLVQPMTLMFRVVDFLQPRFAEYVSEHPDQWRGVHGLWDLVQEATEAGELRLPREDILFFGTPHPREVSVNSTRVTRALGTDVWDLSRAEYAARRQLEQIDRFLRGRVPGFKKAYVAQSGVQIGVRETRRILGEYHLTGHDILAARSFPDAVAHGAYPVDIHNPAAAAPSSSASPGAASTTSPCAVCCPATPTGCWSPDAVSPARTWRTRRTVSCPSRWPPARRPVSAPRCPSVSAAVPATCRATSSSARSSARAPICGWSPGTPCGAD